MPFGMLALFWCIVVFHWCKKPDKSPVYRLLTEFQAACNEYQQLPCTLSLSQRIKDEEEKLEHR